MGNGAVKPAVQAEASARKLEGFMDDMLLYYQEEDAAASLMNSDQSPVNVGYGTRAVGTSKLMLPVEGGAGGGSRKATPQSSPTAFDSSMRQAVAALKRDGSGSTASTASLQQPRRQGSGGGSFRRMGTGGSTNAGGGGSGSSGSLLLQSGGDGGGGSSSGSTGSLHPQGGVSSGSLRPLVHDNQVEDGGGFADGGLADGDVAYEDGDSGGDPDEPPRRGVYFNLEELHRRPEGLWTACDFLLRRAPRDFLADALAGDGLEPVLERAFGVIDADTGPYNAFGGRPHQSLQPSVLKAPRAMCEDQAHLSDVLAAVRRRCLLQGGASPLEPGKRYKLPTRGAAATLCQELGRAMDLADDARLLSALQCYAGRLLFLPPAPAGARYSPMKQIAPDGSRRLAPLSPTHRAASPKPLVIGSEQAQLIDPALVLATVIYVGVGLRLRSVAEAYEARDTELLASEVQRLCAVLGDERNIVKHSAAEEGDPASEGCSDRGAVGAPSLQAALARGLSSFALSPSVLGGGGGGRDGSPHTAAGMPLQVAAADLMLAAMGIELDICGCILASRPALLSHKLMRLRVLLYNVSNLQADVQRGGSEGARGDGRRRNGSAPGSPATSPSAAGSGGPWTPTRSGHRQQQSPGSGGGRGGGGARGVGGVGFSHAAMVCCDIYGDILERVGKRLEELSEHEHVLQKALLLYQSVSEWMQGLVDGTFFHSVVAETKTQFETSVRIRNLASIKASCSTCECLLGIQKTQAASARDPVVTPESMPSQSDKTANLAALMQDFDTVRIRDGGDVVV